MAAGTSVAFGNSRAPRTEPAMPSSAAQPAAAVNVRVLREDLTFRCPGRVCQVTASYVVEADQALKAVLDFMLPIQTRVTARIGPVPVVPTVVLAEPLARAVEQRLNLSRRYYLGVSDPLPPLYQASVALEFVPGRNQITFEYDQPLAAIERGHGYFSKGRMLPEFSYLLWPLKEWTRAKDFAIELRIEVDRLPPSLWKRKFGHPVAVACDTVTGKQEQIGGQLVFRARLGDPFPDVLRCRIGEDDLL